MDETSRQLALLIDQALSLVGASVFGALAIIGAASWMRRREPASAWFAAMFASLTFVTVLGLLMADQGADWWLRRVMIAVLALFPFFLYRFTRSFARGFTSIDVLSSVLTAVVVAATLAMGVPRDREEWSAATVALVIAFLAHWTILSVASAWFFVREARRAPGVAGRRMRLFAVASLTLALALLLAGASGGEDRTTGEAVLSAVVQLGGALSGLLFLGALAPPRWLRSSWRAREFEEVQGGLRELLVGETVDEVRRRTLATAVRLTGGVGAVLVDEAGEPMACEGISRETAHRVIAEANRLQHVGGGRRRVFVVDKLVVACGPAAPFFGNEEQQLLQTICGFSALAEQRAETLEREREANERLRQLDQLKTEFVAMVAHDLRSPMSVITGFADTIHDRWGELSDDDKLAYLRLISRNTRSLAEFVEDVLQVARMESGELHYEVQPFDARAVVERIVTDMQVTHPELTLTIDAPAELPPALGDEERNWQILTNLVGNALKFTDVDPRVRVEIRELPDESAVAIAVCDNGVGIASEDLPRLFRRFSRVGQHRRVQGTGLGLYIVKSMVEAQGGRIWVQSAPGEGSTFTYTLPVAGAGDAA